MRRNDLDYARGIAILLILIGHTINMAKEIEKLIYSFHVPLFFTISGMLLHYNCTSKRRWSQIFSGWLKRIIIPSLIWECILSIFYLVIRDIPVEQLFVNTLTLNFNLTVLWFIPCLLLAQTLVVLILKVFEKKQSVLLCIISMIAFSVAAKLINILFVKRIMVAVIFVIFGYIVDQFQCNKTFHNRSRACYILIISGVIWIIATTFNIRVDLSTGILGNQFLYYLHSGMGSLMVIVLCGMVKKKILLLSWIGKNTLGFLVTHVFIRHGIMMLQEKIFGKIIGGWALAISMILIDIIVVWVINILMPELFGKVRNRRG